MKKMNSRTTLRKPLMMLSCLFAFLVIGLGTVQAQFVDRVEAIDRLTTEITNLQNTYNTTTAGSAASIDLFRKIRYYRNIARDLHDNVEVGAAVANNFALIPNIEGLRSFQSGQNPIPHTSAGFAKNMLQDVEQLLQ